MNNSIFEHGSLVKQNTKRADWAYVRQQLAPFRTTKDITREAERLGYLSPREALQAQQLGVPRGRIMARILSNLSQRREQL